MPEDLRQLGTPIETKDGAQSKADAAENSAINYTDSEVTDHENSTSGVHGVGGDDVASTADVSSIQQSDDVDHNQTSNRTHDGDDLSPDSVDAGSINAELIELPEAKEGDEAPTPTAIAIDPEEGTLLVPEEVN